MYHSKVIRVNQHDDKQNKTKQKGSLMPRHNRSAFAKSHHDSTQQIRNIREWSQSNKIQLQKIYISYII